MDEEARKRRRAYESAVADLRVRAKDLAALGWTEEAVARTLVAERNELKRAFRSADDPRIVALMEGRNLARYGNALGPDADQLFAKYGSWSAVIEAACRPARLSGDLP